MLGIKKHKFMYIGIIVLGVFLLGMPSVYAQDEASVSGWVGSADESVDSNAAGEEGTEYLGSIYEDFLYTPVDPCKIVDTRFGGGGFIAANSIRYYQTWGNLASQGGSTCTSPRGEPRAIHIAVTVINPDGQGNLKVFPYEASGTTGLQVNFAPIGTNLANAGTTKTKWGGSYDIGVRTQYAGCHVSIQVLGYYYPGEPQKITAAASSGTLSSPVGVNTSYTTIVSKSVTIPTSGRIILMGEASWNNEGTGYLRCSFYEDSSQVDSWYWEAGDTTFYDQHQTRFFLKTVSPGFKTYSLRCYRYGGTGAGASNRNLTIQFFKTGM